MKGQQNLVKKEKHFIDLFAGLGGFHVGLSRLGHKCVFAAELDTHLRDIYLKNFNLYPEGDVRTINESEVPDHDVLCAGFPCQPFSRAGQKKGAGCPSSGKLIDDVIRITRVKKPSYVILENVPDILSIDNGRFWNYIKNNIESLGYEVDYRIFTPQEFGIPQKRKRVFVVASLNGLQNFKWPISSVNKADLQKIIDKRSSNATLLSQEKIFVLDRWQLFFDNVNEFSSLPILSSEFGATYPYTKREYTVKGMSKYKGAFGKSLKNCKRWEQIREHLPKYAKKDNGYVGHRVAEAIGYSRDIYKRHKAFLDIWKKGMVALPISWTKIEWQGNREKPNIWDHIIQFRASGIRIIKPDCAPSLVAMTTTQIPILGPEKRYMTVREAAALQSLSTLKYLPDSNTSAFKALGNAVNAHIVNKIADQLIK